MHLVLDANEFVFGLGSSRKPVCERLLDLVASRQTRFQISVCRPILSEIERHLLPIQVRELHLLLRALGIEIHETWAVPFETVERYVTRGLKRGDAFVAGFTEWIGADALISENRKDIVSHPHLFPFKVYTAETFLQKFIAG